jgi:hypothetical protein
MKEMKGKLRKLKEQREVKKNKGEVKKKKETKGS